MAIIVSVLSYLGLTNLPFKLARKVTKENIGQDDTKDKKDTKGSEEAEFCILKREVHVHEELEEVKEPKSIQDPASACFEDSDSPKTPVTEEDASDQMESQDLDPQEASNSVEYGRARNGTTFTQQKEKILEEKMDASNVGRARNGTSTQQKKKIDASNVGSDSSRRLFRKRQDSPRWCIDLHILLVLSCLLSGAYGQCADRGDLSNPSTSVYKRTAVQYDHSVAIATIPEDINPLDCSVKVDVYSPSQEYTCENTANSSAPHNCSFLLWEDEIRACQGFYSLVPMGSITEIHYTNVKEDLHFCVFIEGPNYFCHSPSSVVVRGETPPAPNIYPVSASATSDTATLKWAASSSEGTSYIVTCDPPDPKEPNITLNETEVIFRGLAEGKEYYFRIVAVSNNKKGEAVEINAITSTATFVGLHYRTAFWIVVPILVICLIFTCIYHICLKKGKEECK